MTPETQNSEPEEMAVGRQRLGKHIPTAKNICKGKVVPVLN
jgi:hypothetical protein